MLAFVEVADRGHDVEPADSISGESHHDEGQQDAHADRYDKARPFDVVLKVPSFVEAGEDARNDAHHEHPDEHPEDDTDDARGKRVSGALEQEHLSQVPSL